MTISEAIKQAIDSGSHINAYGCYLLVKEMEEQLDKYPDFK